MSAAATCIATRLPLDQAAFFLEATTSRGSREICRKRLPGNILLTVRMQSGLYNRLGVVRHRTFTSCLIGLSLVAWAYCEAAVPMSDPAATMHSRPKAEMPTANGSR